MIFYLSFNHPKLFIINMNIYIFKRSLFLIAISAILISCQSSKPIFKISNKEKVDFAIIQKNVQDSLSGYFYADLLDRFNKNDKSLTLNEYKHLYFGYYFSNYYKNNKNTYSNAYEIDKILEKSKLSESDYLKLIELTKNQLKQNPIVLQANSDLAEYYRKANLSDSAEVYSFKLRALTETIIACGDGLSDSTAFILNRPSDESFVLDYLNYQSSGSVLYRKKFKVVNLENESPKKIVFNIGEIKSIKEEQDYDYIFEGNQYFNRKDYESALLSFRKSLQRDENDYIALNNIGNTYGKIKKYDSCFKYLDLSIKKNINYFLAWENTLSYLNITKQFSELLKISDECSKLFPKKASVQNYKGLAFNGISMKNDAIICYKKALELESAKDYILNNIGVAFKDMEQADSAFFYFAKSLETNNKYTLAFFNRGNLYAKLHDFKNALADCDKILEIDSSDMEVWQLKIQALINLKELSSAFLSIQKCLEIKPNDQLLKFKLVEVLLQKNEFDSALSISNTLERKNINMLFHSMAYWMQNDFEKANEYNDTLISLDSNNIIALLNKVAYLYYNGQNELGEKLINNCSNVENEFIDFTPKYFRVWVCDMFSEFSQIKNTEAKKLAFRAFIKYFCGMKNTFEEDCDRAREIYKDIVYLDFLRSLDYFFNKEYDRFEFYTDRAIKFSKEKHKILFYISDLYFNTKQKEKTLEYLNRSIEINPNYALPFFRKAIILCSFDSTLLDGELCHKKAIELEPDNSEYLYHYGNCLNDLAKDEEAIKIWDKLIALDSNDYGLLYKKARQLSLLKRYEESNLLLDRVLENDSIFFPALTEKGKNFMSLKKYDDAKIIFDKIILNKSCYLGKFTPFDINKGTSFKGINNNFSIPKNRLNEYLISLLSLVIIENFNKNFSKSMEYAKEYSLLKNDDHRIFSFIADSYLKERQFDNAIIYYKKSLNIKNADDLVLYNLSCAYALNGNTDLAIEALEKSIKLNEKYRVLARTDTDFDSIRKNSKFIELTK